MPQYSVTVSSFSDTGAQSTYGAADVRALVGESESVAASDASAAAETFLSNHGLDAVVSIPVNAGIEDIVKASLPVGALFLRVFKTGASIEEAAAVLGVTPARMEEVNAMMEKSLAPPHPVKAALIAAGMLLIVVLILWNSCQSGPRPESRSFPYDPEEYD